MKSIYLPENIPIISMNDIVIVQTEKTALDSVLYAASQSPQFNRMARISRLAFIIFIVLMAGLFLMFSTTVSVLFILVGGAAIIIFPKFHRFFNKAYFTRLIRSEEYRDQIGEQYTIRFYDDSVEFKSMKTSSRHLFENFAHIAETSEYIFIKLKVGTYLLFPKSQIGPVDELRNHLQSIALRYQISYIDDAQWAW